MELALGIAAVVLLIASAYGGRELMLRRRVAGEVKARRELQAAREASAPVEDAVGTFTCDGNVWSTTAAGVPGPVRLTIYNIDRDELPPILERHRAFLAATLDDDSRIRIAAAAELVGPYNETWRKEGPTLDAEQLAKALTLHSIRLPSNAGEGPFLILRASIFGGQSAQLALDASYEPRKGDP